MTKKNGFSAIVYFLSVIPIGILVSMSIVGYGAILVMVDGPILGPPHGEDFLLWKELLAVTFVWSAVVFYLMTTLLLKAQEPNGSAVKRHLSQSIILYICLLIIAVPFLEVVVQMAHINGYVSRTRDVLLVVFGMVSIIGILTNMTVLCIRRYRDSRCQAELPPPPGR